MKGITVNVDQHISRGVLTLDCVVRIDFLPMHSSRAVPLYQLGNEEITKKILSDLLRITKHDFDGYIKKYFETYRNDALKKLETQLREALGLEL